MHNDLSSPGPATNLPTDRRALLAGIGGLAAGAFLAGSKTAQAGPINPPAGPITSTGKTLTEVEPRIAINSTNTPGSSATSSIFRITQPGSYYLTGNIIATQINRHVIAVAASGVTIDLNGFLIRGLGTLQGALDCIFGEAGVKRVTVRNGHIELAGRHGINLEAVPGCSIEGVSVSLCLSRGIRVGDGSVVADCVAYQNSLDGIATGNGCAITNCYASSNGSDGINTLECNTIANCSTFQNAGSGIDAFEGCTVISCTSCLNGTIGIDAGRGSTVAHCSAFGNNSFGIVVANGSTVSDCAARNNGTDGIQCAASSVILGNASSLNARSGNGAGIHVAGNGCRIEGNNCAGNDRGIRAAFSGNIIIRNTCTGNTINWEIASNNIYGPIIDRRIPSPLASTPAVNGAAAASTLGSTDPNANFTY